MSVSTGDTFVIGEYEYEVLWTEPGWYPDPPYGAVKARVVDKTKTSYTAAQSSFTYDGTSLHVESLTGCYKGCTNLVSAPNLPSTASSMIECFAGCSSLTSVPPIPNTIIGFARAFLDCTSLVNPPSIPARSEGVADQTLDFTECFKGCTSLTSAPTIPSNTDTVRLSNTFEGCISLTTVPALPTNTYAMNWCFKNCTSLVTAPAIPSGIGEATYGGIYGCFFGCTSLLNAPTIPNWITDLGEVFSGCTSLTQAPNIPSSITGMFWCFANCNSLVIAPEIPSSVTNMDGCFANDFKLSGNVIVHNSPTRYSGIFRVGSPSSPEIYLIADNVVPWKEVASTDSTIHLRCASAVSAPTISVTSRRVENGETSEAEFGEYAYIVVTPSIDTENWYGNEGSVSLQVDGDTESTTWYDSNGVAVDSMKTGQTYHTWVNIGDFLSHELAFTVVDLIGKTSSLVKVTFPQAFALMSFKAGGTGVAVGTYAFDDNFTVALPVNFVGNDTDNPTGLAVRGQVVPPTIYFATKPAAADLPVRPCVVIQTSDWSVWYCDNEETPAYHKLSDQNNLKKTDNYLAEVRLTDVDFYSWVTTAANIHTTGTADQLTQARFYANSYANYNLPCVDSHISVYSINGSSGTVWLRCVALDIRTNNIYVNCRNNGTWTGWVLLSLNGHTHSYLPLSGGTLTGSVYLKTTEINRDAANPSADQWGTSLMLFDADNERIGIIEPCRHSDGSVSCYFRSYAESTSGTQYENRLELRTYRDGSRSVGVSDGAIWRSAIGAAATNHSHSYATTSDFPRITNGNEIRFDVNTMPSGEIDLCIGWAWSGGTRSAKIKNYQFFNGDAAWAPVYASNLIDSAGGDRISKMLHASNYMHVETANYGNFGVSWWSSDIRMKSNIEDSDVDALELVNAIEHRSFDMNNEHYPIGYIAQELEKLDPQLVVKVPQSREVNSVSYFTGDYRYQIDPNKVIPYLSKSIQQISAENAELKRKNEELESRLEAIERKLGL